MQFDENKEVALTLVDVLNVYLRPLHNLSTREIFMLFDKLAKEGELLTTLDIQRKLEEQGINLRKKEINLSLHYLAKAGVIERLPRRGKPTIVEYDGRYSFDLWRMRETGRRIQRGLENMVRKKGSELWDLDEERLFNEFEEIPPEQAAKTLESLARLGKITILLSCIFKAREEGVGSSNLEKLTGIPGEEVESLLESVSDTTPESPRLVERREKRSAGIRILRVLGLARGRGETETFYSLTERGRRYAERTASR
jgi:predicted transcriptional regulator